MQRAIQQRRWDNLVQRGQKLLAQAPGYGGQDNVSRVPLSALQQSALHTRMLTLKQQAGMPDADYLLNTDEVAARLGKFTKRVSVYNKICPYLDGSAGRTALLSAEWRNGLPISWRLEWVRHHF